MTEAENPRARVVLSPDEGEKVMMGGLGVRLMVEGAQSGGTFALVEHPIGPRVLAAPLHTHEREDEYTYVLEGEIGVQVGDEVHVARPGDLVFKPRGIPHAFWNAGDTPARAGDHLPRRLRALLRRDITSAASEPHRPTRRGGARHNNG
jgi:mannose-6-phosphate isomerase-like protein (cupin superfamily)